MMKSRLLGFWGVVVLFFCLEARAHQTPVYLHHDTWFKSSTAQSSTLNASQKCRVNAGESVVSSLDVGVASGHYRITLANALPGCSFTQGYLYTGHASLPDRVITVIRPTVFKVNTQQSGNLSSYQKCEMPVGVYAVTQSLGQTQGHYQVRLQSALNNCGFISGYVYEGHSIAGYQAIGITADSVFKKTTASSSSLSDGEKCSLQKGTYALSNSAIESDGQHYKVTMAPDQVACDFSVGYAWFGHSSLPNPETSSTNVGSSTWDFPMPGARFSSGWCVCRNIGTSPHIGQDMFTYGSMRSYAVQDGRIEDITFSSSCGYIAWLRDDFGALWRYVHLNAPYVSEGSRVNRGQVLGANSSYPRSGCGSGAHLHFERRSSGAFDDSAFGKSCQNGYRSCYYDPMTPWRTSSGIANTTISGPWGASETFAGICKVNKKSYRSIAQNRLARFKESKDFNVNVSIADVSGELVIAADAVLGGNAENHCKNGDCIKMWGVAVETTSGDFKQVFFDNAVQNQVLERVTEESFCLPEEVTGDYVVFARTKSGKRIKSSGSLF